MRAGDRGPVGHRQLAEGGGVSPEEVIVAELEAQCYPWVGGVDSAHDVLEALHRNGWRLIPSRNLDPEPILGEWIP